MYTLLSKAKQHLNIDPAFTADDDYIRHLIQTAERAISLRIDRELSDCIGEDGYLPPTIQHAILLLIGTWYANRETFTNLSTNQLPQGFEYLADLEKHYKIP